MKSVHLLILAIVVIGVYIWYTKYRKTGKNIAKMVRATGELPDDSWVLAGVSCEKEPLFGPLDLVGILESPPGKGDIAITSVMDPEETWVVSSDDGNQFMFEGTSPGRYMGSAIFFPNDNNPGPSLIIVNGATYKARLSQPVPPECFQNN